MPKGVYERTPKHNAANSKARTGVPHLPEHNAAIKKGLLNSDNVKTATEKRRGVPHSLEWCDAISKGGIKF